MTFRTPRTESPVLIQDDVPNFSHVILFASETKCMFSVFQWEREKKGHFSLFLLAFAKDITPQSLISLARHNTNLLIALSTKQTALTSLAAEFSLTPAPPNTPLISYFSERDDDTPFNVIPIPLEPENDKKNLISLTSSNTAPVWYSGTSMLLGNNPLIVPILNAPSHAFASDVDGGSADSLVDASERGGEGLWAGSQLGLVTGFQTRNGARVVWTGGVELFSDEFAQKLVA